MLKIPRTKVVIPTPKLETSINRLKADIEYIMSIFPKNERPKIEIKGKEVHFGNGSMIKIAVDGDNAVDVTPSWKDIK